MPIYEFRTSAYARNIYLYGNQKLTDVPAAYVTPVMTYAAENFTVTEIQNALDKGWITEDEFNSTMAIAQP
jgi:hypothetical protein